MPVPEPEPAACEVRARLEGEIPRLRRYLRRHASSAEEAEDALQDALARALRSSATFDPAGSLPAWLRRTGRNALFDLRARAARGPAALGAAEATLAARPAPDPGAREELAHALARLSAVERACLVRFHARGESVDEIARALGLPAGTVKSHLHRARRRLARDDDAEDER